MFSIFSCSGYPSTTSPFFFQPNAQLYLFMCHISKLLCAFLFIVGIHLFVQICIANISLTTLKDKYINTTSWIPFIVRKCICMYQGMLASNSHTRLNPMFVCVEESPLHILFRICCFGCNFLMSYVPITSGFMMCATLYCSNLLRTAIHVIVRVCYFLFE